MNNFPPNVDPSTYSFIAVVIGYAVSESLTAPEANSVGNWFQLIGQFLETYSAQLSLINNRKQNAMPNYTNNNIRKDIEVLEGVVKRMQEELDKIKKRN